MQKSNNPVIPGEIYKCEYPDCNKQIDAQTVRFYSAKHDLIFCPDCFERWADNLPDPEDIRTHTFYGLEEKYIEPDPGKIASIQKPDESFEECIDRVDKEQEEKRSNRENAEYRARMRKYMNERNEREEIKRLNKNRFDNLKAQLADTSVIDVAPKTCPKCESVKTWKSGSVYTSNGKYQRRRCSQCGFAYTEDWSV